jgi:hypothetical protein
MMDVVVHRVNRNCTVTEFCSHRNFNALGVQVTRTINWHFRKPTVHQVDLLVKVSIVCLLAFAIHFMVV